MFDHATSKKLVSDYVAQGYAVSLAMVANTVSRALARVAEKKHDGELVRWAYMEEQLASTYLDIHGMTAQGLLEGFLQSKRDPETKTLLWG